MKRIMFLKGTGWTGFFLGFLMLALAGTPIALAFDSGSSGANGPFPPIATPALTTAITLDLRDGTVTFLPDGATAILPSVPAGGFADGVLHFTTVDIPTGVILSFINNAARTPVTILAQDVNVDGTISLDGEAGAPAGNGRGGFGGSGAFKGGNGQVLTSSPEAGEGVGPGGGKGGNFGNDGDNQGGGGGGGFGSTGNGGQNASPVNRGGTYGTLGLLPLLGGSGGGGGSAKVSAPGAGGGGGGGGGAILIAASGTIDVSGTISVRGGGGGSGPTGTGAGGGGSGGAIRLMAETLTGAGTLNAAGGGGGTAPSYNGGAGGLGRIRLEAVFFSFSGTTTGVVNNGGLGLVFLPNAPTVGIVSVGGTAVPATPTGVIGGTDVTVSSPGTFTIGLAASEVPLGTTISVTAKPETDAAVVGPVISSGLTGTLADGTASVDLTFPSAGLWFLEARATFTLP